MKATHTSTFPRFHDATFDITEKDIARQTFYRLQAETAARKLNPPPRKLKWYEKLFQ